MVVLKREEEMDRKCWPLFFQRAIALYQLELVLQNDKYVNYVSVVMWSELSFSCGSRHLGRRSVTIDDSVFLCSDLSDL